MKPRRRKKDTEFARGVKAAANVAANYNGLTTHPYRLDDCILWKLNVLRYKPRLNKQKLEHPDDAWIIGVAIALAEICRIWHYDSCVVEVAKNCGLTVAKCRAAKVAPYDWRVLKRAGVP